MLIADGETCSVLGNPAAWGRGGNCIYFTINVCECEACNMKLLTDANGQCCKDFLLLRTGRANFWHQCVCNVL